MLQPCFSVASSNLPKCQGTLVLFPYAAAVAIPESAAFVFLILLYAPLICRRWLSGKLRKRWQPSRRPSGDVSLSSVFTSLDSHALCSLVVLAHITPQAIHPEATNRSSRDVFVLLSSLTPFPCTNDMVGWRFYIMVVCSIL